MQRADAIAVLKRVAPALESKDLIPVFMCYCFDGKSVTAYDGVVALSHPMDFGGIKGAVRGKLLLDFLAASRSSDLDVKAEGQQLVLKAGRSKLDTPILPPKDFIFSPPDTKGKSFPVDEALLEGIRKAMVSLGKDPTHPWMLGVTMVVSEGKVTLYSSNNRTASRVRLKLKTLPDKLSTVLPPRFCELLADISKTDKPKAIALSKEWCECSFESGLRLFSRSVPTKDVNTYKKLFEVLEGTEKQLVGVPKGFSRCLERAVVVLPYSANPFTQVKASQGKLTLETESKAGNVRDSLKVEGIGEMEPARFSPDLVLRGLPNAEKFCVLEQCVVLSAPGHTYLVTVVTGNEPAPQEE